MRTMAQTRLLSRQDAAALGATGADHAATTFGSHAGAKAVGALTANNRWLKCTFHGCLARSLGICGLLGGDCDWSSPCDSGNFRRMRKYRARSRRKAFNYSFCKVEMGFLVNRTPNPGVNAAPTSTIAPPTHIGAVGISPCTAAPAGTGKEGNQEGHGRNFLTAQPGN